MALDSTLPASALSPTQPANPAPVASADRKRPIGRLVKNASPADEVVARILEERTAKTAETTAPTEEKQVDSSSQVAPQLDKISSDISQLFEFMAAVHDQEKAQVKAFDALYNELSDYKNDFFYERLKPIMKSLLFLLDSMQEYSQEVAHAESMGVPPTAASVKAHVEHFSDQLLDSLRIAEMEPIEMEDDVYNPKTQRAIEVVTVEKEHSGKVQRVVRSGWKIGGVTLRPSDVVVGKAK